MSKPEDSSPPLEREQFVAALSAAQSSLFRHIYTLLPDPGLVDDVLQETNVVLWRKFEEFDSSREFMPWAKAIARYQVLAALRDRSRDRLVLDEGLVNLISEEAAPDGAAGGAKMRALEKCLSKQPDKKRAMILRRYSDGASVEEMASSMGRPVGSVSQALYRIRQALMRCVEHQLSHSR